MAETGQINQGQSVVSGAPFWEKHTEEGGKRREEKSEGAQKHLRESVQREQTHTHTHTPEGWGHSQNAGEVQRTRRLRRNTSLCL